LSQSDVASAASRGFAGRYDDFDRMARVFKSSGIRRRHAVRPIDWYLTPLGWPERATVYLEGACELFVDAAKQQGARSYERVSCSRSCCLSSGFTAALAFICGCA
jgi:predicted naringenin-chalcone synthase